MTLTRNSKRRHYVQNDIFYLRTEMIEMVRLILIHQSFHGWKNIWVLLQHDINLFWKYFDNTIPLHDYNNISCFCSRIHYIIAKTAFKVSSSNSGLSPHILVYYETCRELDFKNGQFFLSSLPKVCGCNMMENGFTSNVIYRKKYMKTKKLFSHFSFNYTH